MTAQYFTVLTNYGTQAFAKALATNQPLILSSFAVGDGNGQAVTPTADRTALVKETHRANISAVSLDPRNNKQIIIELTIPEDVGGFYIREMGVFDSTNKLVAYANAPESFKPRLESGSGKVQVLRMILKVSNSQAVTLSIDNSVIFVTRQQLTPQKITSSTTNGFDESGHTHEIEKADTTKAGIVQLTNDTGLDSDKLGLSARAGKKLAQLISKVQLALGNYIPNNKKSNSVTSNSNDNVATSSAVKIAYDKGVEAKTAADNAQRSADNANTNANGRVSKSGDVIDGDFRINGQNGSWSKIQFGSKIGLWELEVHPDSHTSENRRFNMKYNGDKVVYLSFPTIGDNSEIVAYRSWVETRSTPWNKIYGKPAFATRWPTAAEQGYSYYLGKTGWIKLPSGLIIQWGQTPVNHNGKSTDIVFPIAFPIQVINIQLTENQMRTVAENATHLVALDVTNTKFTFKMNSTGHTNTSAYWFAIGY
ncbi:phage tail protein [Haemophilus sp. SZY H56]